MTGSYDVPDPRTGITVREHFAIVETWSAFRKDMRTSCVSIFLVLFHRYPEYQEIFPAFRNIQDNELPHEAKLLAHALAVAYYLSSMVDTLDDPQTLMELIRKNTVNHVRRPVTPQHFDQLAIVILQVMQEKLRSRMTATATVAWQKFFKLHNDAVRSIYGEVRKLDAGSVQETKSFDFLKATVYGLTLKGYQDTKLESKSPQKSPSTSPSGSPKGSGSPKLLRMVQQGKQGPKSQPSEMSSEHVKPDQLRSALEHVQAKQPKAKAAKETLPPGVPGSSTTEPANPPATPAVDPSVAAKDAKKVERPVKEAAKAVEQLAVSSHSTEPPKASDAEKADDHPKETLPATVGPPTKTEQGTEPKGKDQVKVEDAAKAEGSAKTGEAPKPQDPHTAQPPPEAAADKKADDLPAEGQPKA